MISFVWSGRLGDGIGVTSFARPGRLGEGLGVISFTRPGLLADGLSVISCTWTGGAGGFFGSELLNFLHLGDNLDFVLLGELLGELLGVLLGEFLGKLLLTGLSFSVISLSIC